MSNHRCEFCENESRMICVRCKKDICKDHAFHRSSRDGGGGGWLCPECNKTSTIFKILFFILSIVVVIFIIVFMVKMFGNLPGDFPPLFP